MKKTWNNPTIEALEISATMMDWAEEGMDGIIWDNPLTGEGCSLTSYGSQCS